MENPIASHRRRRHRGRGARGGYGRVRGAALYRRAAAEGELRKGSHPSSTTSPSDMRPVLLDTDIGSDVDDALALGVRAGVAGARASSGSRAWRASRAGGRRRRRGSSGSRGGRDVPVFVGEDEALLRKERFVWREIEDQRAPRGPRRADPRRAGARAIRTDSSYCSGAGSAASAASGPSGRPRSSSRARRSAPSGAAPPPRRRRPGASVRPASPRIRAAAAARRRAMRRHARHPDEGELRRGRSTPSASAPHLTSTDVRYRAGPGASRGRRRRRRVDPS